MSRVYNFSPGPGTLPLSVMEKVQHEFLNYQGSGMSIIEMSHRGKLFIEVYNNSIERLRRLAAIPERFDILYMSGGASLQFALAPMNLARTHRRAGYIDTGVWSQKAIKQAAIQGVEAVDCGSSKSSNYDHIPEFIEPGVGLDYLHITSNNTIYGTQFHSFPKFTTAPLVIDMSSDFLSKPIEWDNVGLIYAGAQKNAGPSGLTIVIIDRELYSRELESTPTLLRYSTFGNNESSFNTPPTFQIYFFDQVLEWLETEGGLKAIEKFNQDKARLIYEMLEQHSDFYQPVARDGSRSLMNITFHLRREELQEKFLKESEEHRLIGLKGHRLAGGIRASVYNSMSMEGCQKLSEFLDNFANENGS